jgi:phage/plasmid-associated DNA primase
LPTTTNINKLENIDCRNDGGIVIAPPTKYKLLNGEKVKYEYLGGTIEEIPAKLLKQLLPKKKKEKQEFVNEIKHNEIIKLLDLLTTDRSDNYDDWVRVGIIICNELGEEGRELWHTFSKLSDKYDEDECNKKYDSFKGDKDNKLTIATLKMMAKEDSPEEYAKLYKCDEDDILKVINGIGEEKLISDYIINKYLKDNFKCVSDKPTFYYFDGNKWSKDNNNKVFHILSNDLEKDYYKVWNENQEDKDLVKKITILIKKLNGKTTYIDGIIDWIAKKLYEPEFYDICDQNINLIGFNNGVYDTQLKEFRNGKPSDYITKSAGYDFPTSPTNYKNDIEDFLKKLYPNESIRQYTLQMLANSLYGGKFEDIVLTHTGRGQNGKSILQQLIKDTFGEYFFEIPSVYLTKQNKMEAGKAESLWTNLNGVRIATSNEPSDGQKMNDSLIKIIGSKEGIKYRTLYSNIIQNLKIQFQLHIFCNNKIEYDAKDGGLKRRLKVVDYNSKFVKEQDYNEKNEKNNIYLADYKLSEKVNNWKSDFMLMLIHLYDPNYIYIEPEEIVKSSNKYADDNDDIKKFVNDYFEMTNNPKDYLLLKNLKALYQSNKEFDQSKLKNLKEHLEREFNSDFKEKGKVKINNKFVDVRSIIYGWKLISNEDEEEEKSNLDI